MTVGGLFSVMLGASLVGFGWVADRALVAQAAAARAASLDALGERARLSAASVRAAVAAVEESVLADAADPAVAVSRLAGPIGPRAAPLEAPYAGRPRSELASLLASKSITANGLPEAVVARLALGETGVVSSEQSPETDVTARLLAGALPVRPEDVPYLARALGVRDEAAVSRLVERLEAAGGQARNPPDAPVFRRTRRGDGQVEGWTARGPLWLHYVIAADELVRRAGVRPGAELADVGARPLEGQEVAVPDVEGLALTVAPESRAVVRLQALRASLWLAVLVSSAGLVVVRRALARESHANAREKAFLAGVTHELRSPVASIRLLGETLAEGRGDAREYGWLVARESERLAALVERVLAAARVETAPHFAAQEPRELLRRVADLMQPRAERRRVRLEVELAALPTALWDGEAVLSALVNLVDNAIHHGREGGRVSVSAKQEGDAVRLAVADDGPGIARAERRSIFGRFVRGAGGGPGTGLGLYLVEQVALAHGGRVDLQSEEGRGSVFTLILPLHPPPAGPRAP